MPISVSAKKSLRVAERRAGENKTMKSRIKKHLKQATAETISDAFRILDKAAKNHVIHKNKAARLKSRLATRVTMTPDTKAATKKPKTAQKSA